MTRHRAFNFTLSQLVVWQNWNLGDALVPHDNLLKPHVLTAATLCPDKASDKRRRSFASLTTTANWELALRFPYLDGFLRGRASMESQVVRNMVTDVSVAD